MGAVRVAITGGIAEGKSTVLGIASELGWLTGSADEVARQVFARPDTQSAISAQLKLKVPIDRVALRELISSDPSARRELNAITHPLIVHELKQAPWTLTEVPLLVETCLIGLFDRIWIVTCGGEEQLRRVAERVGDIDSARSLISTQLPTRCKLPFGDRIFDSRVSMDQLRQDICDAVLSVRSDALRPEG